MNNSRCVILYERGTIQKLAKVFNVTPMAVRNALRFVSDSDQAEKIREEALKYYGCVLIKKPIGGVKR